MWLAIIRSKFAAWGSAILAAVAMVYIFWTSSRKVQLAEIKSEGAIALEKEKTTWNDEKAAVEIVEQTMTREKEKEAFVEYVNTHEKVNRLEDENVKQQLTDKWTRKD